MEARRLGFDISRCSGANTLHKTRHETYAVKWRAIGPASSLRLRMHERERNKKTRREGIQRDRTPKGKTTRAYST